MIVLHLAGAMMIYTKLGVIVAVGIFSLALATGAQAFCSNKWADVTILCPQPVPYTGPKKLTETSRNLPTVGTPGLYKNWGNGYNVRVYLHKNGTGYQEFPWQK